MRCKHCGSEIRPHKVLRETWVDEDDDVSCVLWPKMHEPGEQVHGDTPTTDPA